MIYTIHFSGALPQHAAGVGGYLYVLCIIYMYLPEIILLCLADGTAWVMGFRKWVHHSVQDSFTWALTDLIALSTLTASEQVSKRNTTKWKFSTFFWWPWSCILKRWTLVPVKQHNPTNSKHEWSCMALILDNKNHQEIFTRVLYWFSLNDPRVNTIMQINGWLSICAILIGPSPHHHFGLKIQKIPQCRVCDVEPSCSWCHVINGILCNPGSTITCVGKDGNRSSQGTCVIFPSWNPL